MSGLVEVTADGFADATASGVVLVDFWAPWCGPCKMLTPVLERLAVEFDGKVTFVKVNVDEQPQLAMQFQVMSVPTMVVFCDGEVTRRMVGALSESALRDELNAALLS